MEIETNSSQSFQYNTASGKCIPCHISLFPQGCTEEKGGHINTKIFL